MDAFLSPNVRRSPRRIALRELSVTSPLRRSVSGNGNGMAGANPPPSPMVTQSASPDERIIQQRGRRSAIRNLLNDLNTFDLSDARSPTKGANDSGFDSPDGVFASPMFGNRTSTPVLASAPGPSHRHVSSLSSLTRKRLQMSPSKDQSKRKRVSRKQKETSLSTSLKGLSQDQLIDIICGLVDKHVDLEHEVKELAPAPDIEPLRKKLTALEHNVYKSFPYSKFGSNRDAFCFRRVKTHLEQFKRECVQMGKSLVDSLSYGAAADYVIMAWVFVHRLPDWDNFDHNKMKIQCFKQLALQLVQVVRKAAMEKEQLRELVDRIRGLEDHGQYLDPCLGQVEKILNKLR